MNWKIIKKLSGFFLFALLLAIVADFFIFTLTEYGRKGSDFIGCYAYDAMLFGFGCQGFIGDFIVSVWLNWPLWLVYSGMFAVSSLKAFAIAVMLWLPLAIYVFSVVKTRRLGNT